MTVGSISPSVTHFFACGNLEHFLLLMEWGWMGDIPDVRHRHGKEALIPSLKKLSPGMFLNRDTWVHSVSPSCPGTGDTGYFLIIPERN